MVLTGDGRRAWRPRRFADLLTAEPLADVAVTDPETPLEILFTSGTTALPKGVVLTHANWLWSGERTSRGLRLDEQRPAC